MKQSVNITTVGLFLALIEMQTDISVACPTRGIKFTL
jgi:hypothetical protein